MRILVTGGAGYIGSHILLSLKQAGIPSENIVVVDDLSKSSEDSVLHGRLIKSDFADPEVMPYLFRTEQFDTAIHMAAYTEVEESVSNPLKYFDNNTAKTVALLNWCKEFGVENFVFSSTAAVYSQPENGQPLTENDRIGPENPYGQSKFMAEEMVRAWSTQTGGAHVILRYFNVAGADPQKRIGQSWPVATHLIKVASQVATDQREQLQIFGTDYGTPDGTCIRDYIHVSDLANAHWRAIDYLNQGGRSCTLNCGYGEGYSVREVANVFSNMIKDFPITEAPRRSGDPACLIADNTLIKQTLNWKPAYDDISFIVKTALDWERFLITLSHEESETIKEKVA